MPLICLYCSAANLTALHGNINVPIVVVGHEKATCKNRHKLSRGARRRRNNKARKAREVIENRGPCLCHEYPCRAYVEDMYYRLRMFRA
jgi:hypothetical protein